MFDWPEPTHTSPMRMSSSSILFLPLTVMLWALPSAFMAGSTTFQLPWASALAVAVASSSFTVTSSPGSAQPQIGNGRSRCNTMWLPMTLGSLTSARTWGTLDDTSRKTKTMQDDTHFFMADLSCGQDVVWGGMAGRHVGSIVASARSRVNRPSGRPLLARFPLIREMAICLQAVVWAVMVGPAVQTRSARAPEHSLLPPLA